MTRKPKPVYKFRGPRDVIADPGEAVWGNGCEKHGCLKPSHGVFVMCPDGIAREFCETHKVSALH